MPVIKSAKKKLRQDKKRQESNKNGKELLKDLVKKARKEPSVETIKQAVRAADKAAKNHIIHKNKAARLKATLSKLTLKPIAKTETKKTSAKAPKK